MRPPATPPKQATARLGRAPLGALWLAGMAACSSAPTDEATSSLEPFADFAADGPGPGGNADSPGEANASGDSNDGSGGATGNPDYSDVGALDRGPGMPIGTGAAGPDDGAGDEGEPDPNDGEEPMAGEGAIDIPVFQTPGQEAPPPCSGCVELSVIVDDINQTNEFAFAPEGISGVRRVVWTVLLPFNSDQLFLRSVVNGGDGPYTFMSANGFALNTPTELVHETGGTISSAGIKMGSAGAWTGNQPVRVFVDSVRFEGPDATITFDAGPEGMVPQTTQRQPRVVFHP